MHSTNIFAFFVTIYGIVQCQSTAAVQQTTTITKLCSNGTSVSNVSRTASAINENVNCICDFETNPPLGSIGRYEINCKNREFDNKMFDAELLPEQTQVLIISWNNFERLPMFIGPKLESLDISNNNITTLADKGFNKTPNLIELILSWNRIEVISLDAFAGLNALKRLDLSHNQLKQFTLNVFFPLKNLEALILSGNKYLNETFSRDDMDLYFKLGVPTTLVRLEINDANLDSIDVHMGTGLKEIYLKYNRFTKAPNNLPASLELVDYSGNMFEKLEPRFLSNLHDLRELHITRTATLKSIEEDAFYHLKRLRVLNLEGCKNLETFNGNAFGCIAKNDTILQHLERVSLRGTKLQRLPSTLSAAFQHLERLDLYGNPLNCDCQLEWVRALNLETYGRCQEPSELNNALLSQLRQKRLQCYYWSRYFYALVHAILILFLLAICAIPIWLLILCMRPSRRMRLQKIGASSPYARITIESNRAEDNYF